MVLPDPDTSKLPPSIKVRQAASVDTRNMAECYYRSFHPSHRFMLEAFPRTPAWTQWWIDTWQMGIDDDLKHRRTFVAVDTNTTPEKLVAFARWYLPQSDGSLEESWPDLPKEADMSVLGPFFSGMEEHREKLMGNRPHWHLEMLGVDPDYQRRGIAIALTNWGCDLADAEDLEVYIDASEAGAPLYEKRFDCVQHGLISLPERPETYGTFRYMTYVRPRKSERISAST